VTNPAAGAEELIFARGIMEIFADPFSNEVTGMLRGADKNSGGSDWGLLLEGYQRFTNTSQIRIDPLTKEKILVRSTIAEIEMVGYGLNGTQAEGWVYEYKGTMITDWEQNGRPPLIDVDGAPVPADDPAIASSTLPGGTGMGGGFPKTSVPQQPTWTGTVIRRCCHQPLGLVAVATATRINSGLTSNSQAYAKARYSAKPPGSVLNEIVQHEAENENVRVRRNYLKLTQAERDEYARGINLLRLEPSRLQDHEMPPSLRFPAIKAKLNRLDDYVIIHQNHRTIAHASPAFLPWHRVFLLNFENDLRVVLNNSNFALPYWDWSDVETRDEIWTDKNLGSFKTENRTVENVLIYNGTAEPAVLNSTKVDWLVSDGPFKDWDHFVGMNSTFVVGYGLQRCFGCELPPPAPGGHAFMNTDIPPELPTQENVTYTLAIRNYDRPPWNDASHPSFRNAMEGWEQVGCSMHNAVHLWVGGHMRDVPIAPNDPVFWLHHSFVDKLWDIWQRRHGFTYTIHRGFLPDRRFDPNRIRQQPITNAGSAPAGASGESHEDLERRIEEEMKNVKPGLRYTNHPWLYAHDSAKIGTHRFDQMLPWNATIQTVLNPINLGYVYEFTKKDDELVWGF